jgi:hypothetical protein
MPFGASNPAGKAASRPDVDAGPPRKADTHPQKEAHDDDSKAHTGKQPGLHLGEDSEP